MCMSELIVLYLFVFLLILVALAIATCLGVSRLEAAHPRPANLSMWKVYGFMW